MNLEEYNEKLKKELNEKQAIINWQENYYKQKMNLLQFIIIALVFLLVFFSITGANYYPLDNSVVSVLTAYAPLGFIIGLIGTAFIAMTLFHCRKDNEELIKRILRASLIISINTIVFYLGLILFF